MSLQKLQKLKMTKIMLFKTSFIIINLSCALHVSKPLLSPYLLTSGRADLAVGPSLPHPCTNPSPPPRHPPERWP